VSEERPSGEKPAEQRPAPGSDAVTDGGYAYSVVPDGVAAADAPPRAPRRRLPWAWIGAMVVVGIAAAGGGWLASSLLDDGGGGHANATVSSVINAFSAGQDGTVTRRYEGALPPGLPGDIPSYPNADVVSSLAQFTGEDVAYLVVYHTGDAADDVVAHFDERLGEDPWQVDAGRDREDGDLRQFSKINDPDVTGVLLVAESQERESTTIVLSVQVIAGANNGDKGEFEPGVSKALPEGFPGEVPAYPDSIAIESAFQHEPAGDTFVVSFITKDNPSSAIEFYRDAFGDKGWDVTDGDSSQSPLPGAEAITFASDGDNLSGRVFAGEFDEDANYARIDIQVSVDK